ncbi:ABC transporter ATP-binding protein [Planosporangium flavigriseum]|uniref:Lipid A export permease/ATP-binding protein MsbA n=1 Tax=Planosporangium flavigriseum TaxID=373681 RepID=A0A8J3LNM9_9ACTN|nr:ABC transporter ATP-binding protein [Planosporangium flavigriseum]NJC67756.1 ABC transporter ATP-binding protein [Planosporangium flavigriseum]GIG76032.1 lipid A export permease/ATP-binding protein MsbA [Planosporangium flavigriseum]
MALLRPDAAKRRAVSAPAPDDDAEYVEQAAAVPISTILRRFWPFVRRRPVGLAAVLGISTVAPFIEAGEVWLFKIVVDDMLIPKNFGVFPRVAALYLIFLLIQGVLRFVDGVLSTWLSQRFLIDLRGHVFRHLQAFSIDFFQRRRLGDLVSRLTSDVSAIESFLLGGAADFVAYAVRIAVFSVMLFLLDWRLALVSLVVAPVFWAVARFFSRRIKQVSRESRRRSGSISVVVEEVLRNVPLVQAYGQQERESNRFTRAAEAKYRAEMSYARLRGVYSPLINGVEMIGALVVIGYGAWQVSHGRLTVGELLVFVTLLSRLYGPIRGINGLMTSAYAAAASAERLVEILDERPSVTDPPSPRELPSQPSVVELHEVSFTYPETSTRALDKVSLRVGTGQVLALVGASGAGKSTIARLLLRFHDPDDGQVTVDGIDLRDLRLDDLRQNIAVVLQETLVFDGTIRDNIAYGRPGATDAEIEAAARAADAHDFVMAMPDGYDTRIGERGSRLSGGQRQRIAIARAMIRDAPVLLMDEPTTGLDPQSGARVLEPARRLMAGRTTIVISHDLLLARDATEIVVLDHGAIVERGTHDELLKRGGHYRQLYRSSGLALHRRQRFTGVAPVPTRGIAAGPTSPALAGAGHSTATLPNPSEGRTVLPWP